MKTHWYFEKKSYDERAVDRIEQALMEPVCEWIESAERLLRRHLAANPTQKTAAQAEASRIVIDGVSAACLYLLIIARDNPHPEQCAIFVGSQKWIRRKRAELMAQLHDQLAKPGTQGVVIEQNL